MSNVVYDDVDDTVHIRNRLVENSHHRKQVDKLLVALDIRMLGMSDNFDRVDIELDILMVHHRNMVVGNGYCNYDQKSF